MMLYNKSATSCRYGYHVSGIPIPWNVPPPDNSRKSWLKIFLPGTYQSTMWPDVTVNDSWELWSLYAAIGAARHGWGDNNIKLWHRHRVDWSLQSCLPPPLFWLALAKKEQRHKIFRWRLSFVGFVWGTFHTIWRVEKHTQSSLENWFGENNLNSNFHVACRRHRIVAYKRKS